MTKIVRKIAVAVGAAALSVGLLGAMAAPADAATHVSPMRDSSWPV